MDMKAAAEALGITKEEVLERAAEIMADRAAREEYIGDSVAKLIKDRVDKAVSAAIPAKIDAVLSVELERYLSTTYTPVDMWGEATGKPTTLRGSLHEQAQRFWEQKVDKSGKPSSYGGEPRYAWMFKEIVAEDFQKAVAQNVTNIVGALKDALRDNARAAIDKHIDTIIRVVSNGDAAAKMPPSRPS